MIDFHKGQYYFGLLRFAFDVFVCVALILYPDVAIDLYVAK